MKLEEEKRINLFKKPLKKNIARSNPNKKNVNKKQISCIHQSYFTEQRYIMWHVLVTFTVLNYNELIDTVKMRQ